MTANGMPISPLNDFTVANGPSSGSTCAIRSFVLAFPADPVSPITVADGTSASAVRAGEASASSTSSTTTAGTPTGRTASTATAPAFTASAREGMPVGALAGRRSKQVATELDRPDHL
ncbi:hypothetical protein ABZ946_23660 [Streptomyces sp. NPDC046324]|uniref:hypothetical protein n=1 Tax=Streptomyces sp. NPDC046324 TaxID=3154915 RepID=UPI0033E8D6C5